MHAWHALIGWSWQRASEEFTDVPCDVLFLFYFPSTFLAFFHPDMLNYTTKSKLRADGQILKNYSECTSIYSEYTRK